MYKLRLTYTKTKNSIFLSLEEELKVLERALNRVDIKLQYNREQECTIIPAAPLIYGIESTGEMCDVYIEEPVDTRYIIRSLNNILPIGITIMAAECLEESVPDICEIVEGSIYEITPEFEVVDNMTKKQYDNLILWYRNSLLEYLSAPMLLVLIKLPARNERIDIKPNILDYDILINSTLRVTVKEDKIGLFNPKYIMDGFEEQTDKNIKYKIKRTKIIYKK